MLCSRFTTHLCFQLTLFFALVCLQICVFGYRANHDLDAIAVDDIVLTGVDGSQIRLPLSPALD